MTKLPVVSGRDTIKALSKVGYLPHHRRGTHVTLKKRVPPYNRIVVPDHKEIRKGTLKAILRKADLTVEDFVKLVGRV